MKLLKNYIDEFSTHFEVIIHHAKSLQEFKALQKLQTPTLKLYLQLTGCHKYQQFSP